MNHQDRINAILEAMAADGLDLVIAFSPAAHHVDFGDAVALISGAKPMGPSFAVLTDKGEARLVVSPSWDLSRAEKHAQTGDVVSTDDLAATFRAMFADKLPAAERIGAADLGKMSHRLADDIKSVIG
ncbi:MAG: aminopeptidase P family N-terminal domain-containing protein, partial [Rhodospirillales bacterium]|nr:aminopeptidase P family N-terminal domain-containing protein [Rhodospirillales bacterium]